MYPSSKFVRSTAPTQAQEPVTPDEAKRSIGLAASVSDHDSAIARFIAMAREQVEKDTGIACYTGTYVRKETCWTPYYRNWFELNIRPVTAIAIAYVASDGTSTWSSAEYTLDTSGVVPIVRLNDGYSWPTLRGDINGITLTVTAGYTTVAAIPAMVKQAVLLEVARMFKLEAGEDIKNYESSYDSLAERIGREVYA